MHVLLFHRSYAFLGEFKFEDGALRMITLSAEGESCIGQDVAYWHQIGIPVMERVLLRDTRAYEAFRTWADEQDFFVVDLPLRLFSYWQRLSALALEPEKRFVGLQTIRSAPHQALCAWDQALDQGMIPIQRASS